MKKRVLVEGNHAIVEGSIQAGCRYFFGYPITPQSEVLEYMSVRLGDVGGSFLQAESEVSAMNMVLGASVAGGRVMTASSGPGMDLMQEGIGNMVAHQLPCVLADIMRGGPGNGAIHPSQQDYNQAVKGGRGDQRCLVLAPWNVQEMYDLTKLAFELADKYRNPAVLLADAVLGHVMEGVEMDDSPVVAPSKEWALTGAKGRPRKISIAHFPVYQVYNDLHKTLQEKYDAIRDNEQRSEQYHVTDNTRLMIVSFGIAARNSLGAVLELRKHGYPVALFRPISLFPFPVLALKNAVKNEMKVMVVEVAAGQMAADVQLTLPEKEVIYFPGQATAQVPGSDEIAKWAMDFMEGRKHPGRRVRPG